MPGACVLHAYVLYFPSEVQPFPPRYLPIAWQQPWENATFARGASREGQTKRGVVVFLDAEQPARAPHQLFGSRKYQDTKEAGAVFWTSQPTKEAVAAVLAGGCDGC